MITLQHGHYRPDAVTRTSVVEPYDIRQVSPVDVARGTINPFIYGIRAPGAMAPGQGTAGAQLGAAQAPLTSYGRDYGQKTAAAARQVPDQLPQIFQQGANPQVRVPTVPLPSASAGMVVQQEAAGFQPAYLRHLMAVNAAGQYRYDNVANPRRGTFWGRVLGGQGLIQALFGKRLQLPFLLQVK
jgi:hypothetical protein